MRTKVLVVGAGHAGLEAAFASARLGVETVLLSSHLRQAGRMPCNPAVGGMAKGHLVRELDALGGAMGVLADAAAIQFKRLGTSRGLAVQSSRAQCDKYRYRLEVARLLGGGGPAAHPVAASCLRTVEGKVAGLLLEPGRVTGVRLENGSRLEAEAVVLCAGTFLGGRLHTGLRERAGGRAGEGSSEGITEQLGALGLPLGRMKTGTVPRLDRRSIDWESLPEQEGDDPSGRFSHYRWTERLPQLRCRVTHTNEATVAAVRQGLDRSPVHVGLIEGPGPRYCPSIEDKICRFPDRSEHRIFLEPEGLDSLEIYPNGISTALPVDVQLAMVRSIPGLEEARITRPGYAVAYDYIDPIALDLRLGLPELDGLFFAGQLNGTTGYEEAAVQGLWAGVNAAHWVQGKEPFHLGRHQAYLGVLVSDLTARGTSEPYRMFSSRAEHRLLLREDNADERLLPLGRELGLVDDACWAAFEAEQERRAQGREILGARRTPAKEERARLEEAELPIPKAAFALGDLFSNRGVSWHTLEALEPKLATQTQAGARALEAEFRYGPILAEERRKAESDRAWMDKRLPSDLDYGMVGGLRSELRDRWSAHRPETVEQAAHTRGATPAAVHALIVYLAARTRPPK